mmetsp:Transcript_75823/g.195388  ORF Transcript_75823/g.195388 Transcript_75823/m.195388 type:complete len:576 (+) Transcript_75823:139-1866(+)
MLLLSRSKSGKSFVSLPARIRSRTDESLHERMPRNVAIVLAKVRSRTRQGIRSSSGNDGRSASGPPPSSSDALGAESSLNGFQLLPEFAALHVDAGVVAPFSLPQDLLTSVPSAEAVTSCFKNGESERKLHLNIELAQQELETLRLLQELARAQGKAFLPSLAMAATRYLGRAKWDHKRALRDMLATQEWRLAYFRDGPIPDDSVSADLAHGMVYFTGRDRLLRPALVLRPARIPPAWHKDTRAASERLLKLLVFCIEYMLRYMLLPGRVEGGVVLLDMGGLSLAQVPFGPLKQILTVLSNHYVNRIFKFYILNTPSTLSRFADFGLRLLTERQRQKLQFVKQVEDLGSEFALHQLEVDLGGTRSTISTFFPFPVQAGPFEANSREGPDPSSVPCMYKVITPAGMRGRVWDPARSKEENTHIEFATGGEDTCEQRRLLERLGLCDDGLMSGGTSSRQINVEDSNHVARDVPLPSKSCPTCLTTAASADIGVYDSPGVAGKLESTLSASTRRHADSEELSAVGAWGTDGGENQEPKTLGPELRSLDDPEVGPDRLCFFLPACTPTPPRPKSDRVQL